MKKYYRVAILKRALNPLVYSFDAQITPYSLVQVLLNGKKSVGVVIEKCEKPNFKCLDILFVSEAYFTKEYFLFAKFISQYYVEFLGKSLALFEPFYSKKPTKKISIKTKNKLSPLQEKALEFVEQNQISLLFADTGSGKTEIYIKAIEKTLNVGKTALFLMPEISLTPQMTLRLKEHFGSYLDVWHSKLTKKQKEKTLNEIANGKIRLILGARSALFLPLHDLGLIVVDEEHDDSYKSDTSPRYNARDLSIYLAKILNARVILGSATPSVTSYKKFPFFRIKEQFFTTQKNFIFKPSTKILDEETIQLIKKNLEKNHQAIVFVPTRANYKTLICKDCKTKVLCPFCSVSLSLHFKKNLLKCHYCGFSSAIFRNCEACGSSLFEAKRIGTAEVAKILKEKLPDFKIEQFDKDEVNTKTKLEKKLKNFSDGKIDLLVGTQMLSKGHNYHNINLAVITGIDYILNSCDYKAEERAMALMLQIAGRAGRKQNAQIIVLSDNAEFFSKYLTNFELFLEENAATRKELYPPFKKLARIVIEEKTEETARKKYEKTLKILGAKQSLIAGSGECASYKLKNKFRYFVLLRGTSSKELSLVLHKISSLNVIIDVDPVYFY